MSKKLLQRFVCQDCGALQPKWSGKCTDCGSWSSIIEEVVEKPTKSSALRAMKDIDVTTLNDNYEDIARTLTNIKEFDRVLGGGLVGGSAVLIGGDPGIGKSTLLLQVISKLSSVGANTLYISGEESVNQIKLRASRLKLKGDKINLAAITSLQDIKQVIEKSEGIELVIIDSIQTIFDENIESSPGSVSQVRACAFELIRMAKDKGFAIIFVGHVTKEGAIAGPKVLEHMVDTVLYFEGDRSFQYRIIRAVKNRFGAANEIGVFAMSDEGLSEVSNPSEIFLPNNNLDISGSCIFAGIEGSRPILMEVQALVVPSYLPSPRRAVVGWDVNRLAMIIAVLNSRLGINLLDKEVYLNIVGGIRVNEPAADLAALVALISAAKNIVVPRDNIFLGEIGLSGEIRQVSQIEQRVHEAEKLGFKKAFIPKLSKNISCNIDVISANHISELKSLLGFF